MATRRLRLVLRIWTVLFALGAVDFFVFPYLTVRIVNAGGAALHMAPVTALDAGHDFWLTLAVPYMILVAVFSWVASRGPRIQAQPVQFLLVAKASSSLTSLALFLLAGQAYAFLANFVIDGSIVVITFWLYRAAKSELVFPATVREAPEEPARAG